MYRNGAVSRQADNASGSKKEGGICIYRYMLGGQMFAWWLGSAADDHVLLTAVIIGSVYIAVSAIRSLLAWKHSSITLTDSYVAVNSGIVIIYFAARKGISIFVDV